MGHDSVAPSPGGSRWWQLGPGIICLLVTAGIWRLDWGRVPTWFVRGVPYAGLTLIVVVGIGAPRADRMLMVVCAAAMMFTGIALERADLYGVGVFAAAAVGIPQWLQYSPATAIWHTVEVMLMLGGTGITLHWLRARMDETADRAVRAQVAAAVERVAEITTSMGELASHNGALAAAIEEQSASVQQVSSSVQSTAVEVGAMADGIHALERLSRRE